ncbi:hypothetical protein [Sinomonas halotolerans]|uniref:DUF4166 domain-containing protein n=1 Tax=Sinomonas halotolerans TaxID=1644133 RepID=A0ABU9WV30_9MICC
MEPRTAAQAAEDASAPPGADERFAGYGVMGVPFALGHVLALRRFPVSTVGPAYSAVWIRDPAGRWTMAASAPPAQSCARYFGAAVELQVEAPVEIAWTGARELRVEVPAPVSLEWSLSLRATPLTSAMSAACAAIPDGVWRGRAFSRAMGLVAAGALRTGTLRLAGTTPNGHHFVARPRRVWLVEDSTASLDGTALGRPAPLPQQAALGDFWLPQRGLFMAGWSAFATAS